MNTKKFEQGGMIATQKEVEQQKTINEQQKAINKLSNACLQMDWFTNGYYKDRQQERPQGENGSPLYYLNQAVEAIRKLRMNG